MLFYNNFKNKNLKIAHRGYRSQRAENTLSAFEYSIGKFDFIELDIQVTKDNRLVVFHDYTLNRTTNITENNNFVFNGSYNIYDYTLEELKLLDISSWFLKVDPFDTIQNNVNLQKELKHFSIQKIMTFDDILQFANTNNIAINIELKDCSYIKDELFIKKVYQSLKKAKMKVPFLISSFNHNYLKLLKTLDLDICTAANIEKRIPNDFIGYLKNLKVEACHIASELIDDVDTKELIKNDFTISVFTVNDKNQQEDYFKRSIRAVFTDIL